MIHAAHNGAIGARLAVMAALGLVVAAPGEFAAGRSMMALSRSANSGRPRGRASRGGWCGGYGGSGRDA